MWLATVNKKRVSLGNVLMLGENPSLLYFFIVWPLSNPQKILAWSEVLTQNAPPPFLGNVSSFTWILSKSLLRLIVLLWASGLYRNCTILSKRLCFWTGQLSKLPRLCQSKLMACGAKHLERFNRKRCFKLPSKVTAMLKKISLLPPTFLIMGSL